MRLTSSLIGLVVLLFVGESLSELGQSYAEERVELGQSLGDEYIESLNELRESLSEPQDTLSQMVESQIERRLLIGESLSESLGESLPKCQQKNQMLAVKEIGNIILDLMNENTGLSEFVESSLPLAFGEFDADSDGVWSRAEFDQYLVCLLDFEILFNRMNINRDSNLSFRELAGFLMHTKGLLADTIYDSTIDIIKNNYDFQESDSKRLFFEYLADAYLVLFDPTAEAHITRNNFVNGMHDFYFSHYDVDQNMVISFEEFIEHQFSTDGISGASKIVKPDGSLRDDIDPNDWFTPYNKEDLLNIAFETCPSVFSNPSRVKLDIPSKRRLLSDQGDDIIACGIGVGASGVCWLGIEEFTLGAATPACAAASGATVTICTGGF